MYSILKKIEKAIDNNQMNADELLFPEKQTRSQQQQFIAKYNEAVCLLYTLLHQLYFV